MFLVQATGEAGVTGAVHAEIRYKRRTAWLRRMS